MQRLSEKAVIVLDGGMGHELRRRGVVIEGVLGTMERFSKVAMANVDAPEIVVAAHAAYLKAGADVITTNSYACVPAALGGNWAAATAAAHASGRAARKAANDAGAGAIVAGCLPPLHESYRPDKVAADEELNASYPKLVSALLPWSDIFLAETMSSAREGAAAFRAAASSGRDVWVSWTLREDGRLRSGESVEEAVAALAAAVVGTEAKRFPKACLINCSSHRSIVAALPSLASAVSAAWPNGNVRVGAYANGFEPKFRTEGSSPRGGDKSVEYNLDLSPAHYLGQCREYLDCGATIVGGCCGVFPEHIEALQSLCDCSASPFLRN